MRALHQFADLAQAVTVTILAYDFYVRRIRL